MAEAILRRRGGLDPKGLLPKFTYTGTHNLVDEGKVNKIRVWNITMSGGGTFTPNRDMLVDLFVIGAGGAGNKDGLGGGGGYHRTANCVRLNKGQSYAITIGSGGDTNGEAGGQSSAFGYTVNGGVGGVAGTKYAETCLCKCAQGGSSPIRYATSTDPSEWDYEASSEEELKLKYPREWVNITVGGQNVFNTIVGYDGSGSTCYYYVTVQNVVSSHYSNGSTGTGGAATTILNYGTTVGGAGADSGGATINPIGGQGGAGNGSYGGNTWGKGGNGIAVICNTRYNTLDTAGYTSNTRYSTSSSADVAAEGWDITGFIPAKKGDTVRFASMTWYPTTENSGRGSIYMYDSNKNFLTNLTVTSTSSLADWSPIYDSNGNITQITLPSGVGSTAYIRICCQDLNKTSVVTVNTPIG